MARPASVPLVFGTIPGNPVPVTLSQLDGNFNALVAAINDPLTYIQFAQDTGALNALIATFNPPVTTLQDGFSFTIRIANTNSGATTLNVNGTGALPVIGASGGAMTGGQLVKGNIYNMTYSATVASYVVTSFAGVVPNVSLPQPIIFYWT